MPSVKISPIRGTKDSLPRRSRWGWRSERSFIRVFGRIFKPIREKTQNLEADKGYVEEVIMEGTEQMREVARQNMNEVRKGHGAGEQLEPNPSRNCRKKTYKEELSHQI